MPPWTSAPSPPQPCPHQYSTALDAFSSPHSDSIHDDDDTDDGLSATDTSPFLAGKRGSARPSWTQFRASVLAPVRIRKHLGRTRLASVSALLFSLAFEESASLYVAVLLETAGFNAGNGSSLRKSWRFSLAAVQALAIVFIPLAVCLLFSTAATRLRLCRAVWPIC